MNALSPLRLPEGIHLGVPETAYHADCAQTPSASSGILRTILDQTPMHAHAMHPRLGGDINGPGTEAQNIGTILHSMVLGTPSPVRILDVDDYRTNAARALRDETIAADLIPMKRKDMQEILDTAASIRARLQALPDVWAAITDARDNGMCEATLIWREGGTLCRVRYDTLPAARFGATYDLKFTGKSASPYSWGKTLVNDYTVQADLYPRAVKSLRGDRPAFVFLVCETTAPYAVSLHAMAPDLADLARRKVDHALRLWRECLAADHWPGYPDQTYHHAAPSWASYQWEEREMQMEDTR